MCIAVPAKILEITPGPVTMCRVQHGGQTPEVCLAYFPEAEVGDYVLVQHGFAVELLDEAAAQASLAAFAQLEQLAE
ncbi:MAG: HypC/HybG/HupF family hydrogenase formation chaperone [Propionibacteriaceae bacterium]|jgi:hydrogenase expression/formation protein HypC|nr:HypC/HybG/HupF family hydrogenase formation chaperone [Propionibacteriaceae bacterium]